MTQEELAECPKYEIIRCLLDKTLDARGSWWAFEVFPHEVPLGKGVLAFVYRSRRERIHIFINSALSDKRKMESLCHELKHIIEDLLTWAISLV